MWVGIVAKHGSSYGCVDVGNIVIVISHYSINRQWVDGYHNNSFVASNGVSVVADGVGVCIIAHKIGIRRVGKCTIVVIHNCTVKWLCKADYGKCVTLWVGIVT